jgi:general secretion pathway protein H
VIIGIVTTGILLAVSVAGRDRGLETEGERLIALMKYAREKAELQTREYGLLASRDGFAFLLYDPRREEWKPVENDDALRQRKLPEGLQVSLVVEGRPVVLKPDLADALKKPPGKPGADASDDEPGRSDASLASSSDRDRNTIQPQLMLFSNGDLTSFELTLQREGSERTLTIAIATGGKLELRDSDRKPT